MSNLLALLLVPACAAPTCQEVDIQKKMKAAYNLYEAGAYAEVITVLDSVVESGEATPDERVAVLSVRARCHGLTENFSSARKDCTQAIGLITKANKPTKKPGDPRLVELYEIRGLVDSKLGDHRGAISDYRKALAVDPANASVSNALAWLLATCPDKRRHDGLEAVHFATVACTATKFEDPQYLDTLAAAFARAGRFTLAVQWQESALAHPRFQERFEAQERKQCAQRLKLYLAKKVFVE